MKKTINQIIKNHVVLSFISILAILLLATGTTYAVYSSTFEDENVQSIAVGNLSFDINDSNNLTDSKQIILNDIYPVKSNNDIGSQNLYTFSIKNSGTYRIRYDINMSDITSSIISDYESYSALNENYYSYINYRIDDENYLNNFSHNSDINIISGELSPGEETATYSIQFWLDETAPNDINGSLVGIKLNVKATALD